MHARMQQCYSIADNVLPEEHFCQAVFDGYLCWQATAAGILAQQPCPHAHIGEEIVETNRLASKLCGSNGEWYVDPATNYSTNYSECAIWKVSDDTALLDFKFGVNSELEEQMLFWYPILNQIRFCGFWASITMLAICVAILIGLKKLHCARNLLHIHLFMSFILRALSTLFKEYSFINGIALEADTVSLNGQKYITENFHWSCKLITCVWAYFQQTNYMFILMEGIYLHNLMFLNLLTESSSVRLYYTFGWGLPMMFISLWALLRVQYDNYMCWTLNNNKYISWLTQRPIEISMIINFILFVSITRMLCIKINSMYVQHKRVKYRRLIRSTLTLLLIYTVPYAISAIISLVVAHSRHDRLEVIWIFCDQSFTAIQGVLMGLIYCLLNGEVQSEIKQTINSIRYYHKYNNCKNRRVTRTISNTLQLTIPPLARHERADSAGLVATYRTCDNNNI